MFHYFYGKIRITKTHTYMLVAKILCWSVALSYRTNVCQVLSAHVDRIFLHHSTPSPLHRQYGAAAP